MTKIALSHSQAESLNQCEYKFKYAHLDNLEPITRGVALQRGTNGHKFFETFLTLVKAGLPVMEATDKGLKDMMEENSNVAVLNMPLVMRWVQEIWIPDWSLKYEIVLVEETHRIELGSLGQFPYTMDAVLRDKNTGELWMLDHKFLGMFYSEQLMGLMPQMPKYIASEEKLKGVKFAGAIYNMLCTAPNAKELFKVHRFKVSEARKTNAMREQVETFKAVEEITSGKRLPVRTINKMNCGNCSFKALCLEEINGEVELLEFVKETQFKPNTYGYDYLESVAPIDPLTPN